MNENYNIRRATAGDEQILSDMEKAGYAHTLLWVFEKNIRARKFYEAKGFHKTEKAKEFCGVVEVMYEK
jgi:ribosomal protein S18 acetylase RimI-like enzyme